MIPGSSVLAVTDDLDVYLTREYKYAVSRVSLEIVSGGLEPGETPLVAAQRELREELGLEATRWLECGSIEPFTTIVNSTNYLFIALDLEQRQLTVDPDEEITFEKVPLSTAVDLVMQGRITHGASCVLILKAQAMLVNAKLG